MTLTAADSHKEKGGLTAVRSEEHNMQEELIKEALGHRVDDEPVEKGSAAESQYSVTARWRERANKYKEIAIELRTWSEQDPKKMELIDKYTELFQPYPNCSCSLCREKSSLQEHVKDLMSELESLPNEQGLEPQTVVVASSSGPMTEREAMLEARAKAAEAKSIALRAKSIALRAKLIEGKARAIAAEARVIFERHDSVKGLLGGLRYAANGSTFYTDASGSRRTGLDPERFDSEEPVSPPNIDKLLDRTKPGSHQELLPHLHANEQEGLLALYRHLKALFTNPNVLDAKDLRVGSKITETVQKILRCGHKPLDTAPDASTHTPPCLSTETKGAQPFLYAIMFSMAQSMGFGLQVTREQLVLATEKHPARSVDLLVNRVTEHLRAVLPVMVCVPIEVKPTERKCESWSKLLAQGLNQIIGHLAKMLLAEFNFGGIGRDCKVTGAVLTMVSIEVVSLELTGMGTADAEVQSLKSGPLPLFDKETTNGLLKGMKQEKQEDILGSLFGGENNVVAVSKTGAAKVDKGKHKGALIVPRGFLLLARVLKEASGMSDVPNARIGLPGGGEFWYSEGDFDSNHRIQLGQYLGSGSFAHVYALKEERTFVKIPRTPRMKKSLEREARALLALQHESIPKLHQPNGTLGIIFSRVRCEKSTLPCLCLNGIIGKSASEWLAIVPDRLNQICAQARDALDHAHSKGWFHLDVRPSNIIVGGTQDKVQVLLTDWGCADQETAELSGFRGCPPYAHDDLLDPEEAKSWSPTKNHDMASLAYTIARLQLGGAAPPWGGFHGHKVESCYLDERRKTSVASLKDSSLDENDRKILLEAISKSEHDPDSTTAGNCNGGNGVERSAESDVQPAKDPKKLRRR